MQYEIRHHVVSVEKQIWRINLPMEPMVKRQLEVNKIINSLGGTIVSVAHVKGIMYMKRLDFDIKIPLDNTRDLEDKLIELIDAYYAPLRESL